MTTSSLRYPTDSLLNSSSGTPIKCYRGFRDGGFSGWYAISNPRKCQDYCFWEVTTTVVSSNATSNNNTPHIMIPSYNPYNVADPHQTTSLEVSSSGDGTVVVQSHWRCLLGASDNYLYWNTSNLLQTKQLTKPGHFGPTFQYLQCARGVNEKLETFVDELDQSEPFWVTVLASGILLLLVPCLYFGIKRRKQRRKLLEGARTMAAAINDQEGFPLVTITDNNNTSQENDNDTNNNAEATNIILSEEGESLVSAADTTNEGTEDRYHDETTTTEISPSSNNNNNRLQGETTVCPQSIIIIIIINLIRRTRSFSCRWSVAIMYCIVVPISLFFLIVSSLSILELSGRLQLTSDKDSHLTPWCDIQYLGKAECKAGYNNIDRPSSSSKPPYSNKTFSYLIASDVQLDWYDGESADLGQSAIPQACSKKDSCGSCTYKMGTYTNQQLQKAIQNITSGNKTTTLVVNGDLTAYYHPYQRQKYESFYHNIEGLTNYFPSLGNHEIDHFNGGKYGGDQWMGSPYCNSLHSLAYMRLGFCNQIPKFHPNRIVRYDAASLAYSWEEGNYHFVHTHYYPSFESAGLGLRSSLEWLERDLTLASRANLTTVLFVHASQGLGLVERKLFAGKNIKAIFAGHSHRCFMRKCVGPSLIYEDEIVSVASDDDGGGGGPDTNDDATTHHDNNNYANASISFPSMINDNVPIGQCLPGTAALCGGNLVSGSQSLFYLQNTSQEFEIPEETKLHYDPYIPEERKDVCPAPTPVAIINNTAYCKYREFAKSNFWTVAVDEEDKDGTTAAEEQIPIFWSGSASYGTFLKVDFLETHIVVNAMTASSSVEEGQEGGQRYVDAHTLPNVVYPYHSREDLEAVVIVI